MINPAVQTNPSNAYASQYFTPYAPWIQQAAPVQSPMLPEVASETAINAANVVHPGFMHMADMALNGMQQMSPAKKRKLIAAQWFHPLETWQLFKQFGFSGTAMAQYRAVRQALDSEGRARLFAQLKVGRLADTQSDDGLNTLAHLYSIISTPAAPGLQNDTVLAETVRLLSAPESITQRFATLSPEALNGLMSYYQSGYGPQMKDPLDLNMLRVATSATCVSSSLMFYMVKHCPSEFVRHIAGLTSPQRAFYEKAHAAEISPQDPSKAEETLQSYGISAVKSQTDPSLFWVKVNLPYSGYSRAIDAQRTHSNEPAPVRGVVESLYQGALTHLVVQNYDPGLDLRVNPDGTLDPNKGLEEDRKTLMESIIKDNGGVMSVTYQFTANSRENDPYLMGYYRDFDKTTQDLINAIDMGEDVIIGITDTDTYDTVGRINMGHEITVTGYERDPQTGELMLIIADSDDDTPTLVRKPAKEIVPMIHHAGFPARLAKRIQAEIQSQVQNNYLLPGPEDAARFQLLKTVPAEQQPAFLAEFEKMVNEMNGVVPPQPTGPSPYNQPNRVPVYQAPPTPAMVAYNAYPGSYSQSYTPYAPYYAYPQAY